MKKFVRHLLVSSFRQFFPTLFFILFSELWNVLLIRIIIVMLFSPAFHHSVPAVC